jgi:hypothetical protein
MLLLFLGFTFGIMFTTVANKREVDNLNGLLNQTRNLVQYLHEELEMKDLYIVKEEGDEDFESRGTNEFPFLNHTPIASSTEPELDKSAKYDQKERDYHKAEDSEAITKIEAELEAELERLELNMKTSSLEKISDYVEVIMSLNIIKFGCILFALKWTIYDHLIVMWFCYMYWSAS